jgi:hypothetical protein
LIPDPGVRPLPGKILQGREHPVGQIELINGSFVVRLDKALAARKYKQVPVIPYQKFITNGYGDSPRGALVARFIENFRGPQQRPGNQKIAITGVVWVIYAAGIAAYARAIAPAEQAVVAAEGIASSMP